MSPATRESLQAALGLQWPPIAIAFRDSPPPGVSRIPASAPAGCSYWQLAAQGLAFYTEAADHFGCPVGAHTHGVELPPDTAGQLNEIVQTMVGLQYITMDEVPTIPRRPQPLRIAVYAPLTTAPFDPDVVLVRGTAKQLMLLAEAAQAAGIASGGATLGRPTCAVLPETLQSGRTAASFGCIGNRVYTGLTETEGYYAIPGPKMHDVLRKLPVILDANRALEAFHRSRLPGRQS
jgi:uncharacterized protein (DUF169 family)